MRKKVIFTILMTLAMVLGNTLNPLKDISAASKSWKDAYADVLLNSQWFYKYNKTTDESHYIEEKPYYEFALHDMDNNGIPELIVRWELGGDGHIREVFTYSNGIKHLGTISMRDELYISNSSKFCGLFYTTYAYYGNEMECYTSIKNNKLKEEIVYQMKNEEIIKKNKLLFAEDEKTKPLPNYYITDRNIANVIYNYGENASATNPHPYTKALDEFIGDNSINARAYLEDINSDGTKEMIASKYDGTGCERLFYMYKNKLFTFDIEDLTDAYTMYFSTNKHLIVEFISNGDCIKIMNIKPELFTEQYLN